MEEEAHFEQDALKPASSLGGFRLILPLGRGGMGEVWLARLEGTLGMRRFVALKTIAGEIANIARFRGLFLDEARCAAWITHPNVVSVLRMGSDAGRLFYVMDWVGGGSVGSLMRACEEAGQSIPYGISARIIADVCVGLHAAHEARDVNDVPLRIAHRDISPQNILLTDDGIPRLTDFGISKARIRVSETTRPGTMMGRPEYASPEQMLGQSVDYRTDIWAAGAVLYHLFAGYPMTQQATAVDGGADRLPAPRGPLDELPPDLPAGMKAVLERALRRDREARFATALELSIALEKAMTESGLQTSRADVAAFAEQWLAESRRSLREAIAGALASMDPDAAQDPANKDTSSASGGNGENETRSVAIRPTGKARGPSSPPSPQSMRRPVGAGQAAGSSDLREETTTMEKAVAVASSAEPLRRRSSRMVQSVLAALALATVVVFMVGMRARPHELASPSRVPAAADSARTTEESSRPVAAATEDSPPRAAVPRPTDPPQAKPAGTGGVRKPATAPSRARPTACSPPYVVDGAGIRTYKIECL
jgi:serine/threonine protein kinase